MRRRLISDAGRRIMQARQRLGLTQQDLATAIGCPSSAISRIEAGKLGISEDRLRAVAEVLGVKVQDLTGSIRDDGTRFSHDFLPYIYDFDPHLSLTDNVAAAESSQSWFQAPVDPSAPGRFAWRVSVHDLAPRVYPGDIVVVTPCGPGDLEAGDAVLLHDPTGLRLSYTAQADEKSAMVMSSHLSSPRELIGRVDLLYAQAPICKTAPLIRT